MRSFIVPVILLALVASIATAADKPNIIHILCDDLGYGDVAVLNPDCKIKTPHMDRLAKGGMIFSDAHTNSSVCTPTRYGVMTGRYAWRTKLKSGVLGGLSPHLIDTKRLTVARLLQESGYHTACIGKWHLGMDWVIQPGKDVTELGIESAEQVWNVDYTKPIANGPLAVGFDYYHGISASLDMVPYVFIENDRVTKVPTVEKEFQLYVGRDNGRFCRKGPATPEFEIEDVLPMLTAKVVAHIESRAAEARNGVPFFIYLPLNSPHTPIAPSKDWQGRSGISGYADFVMQTDDTVGRILDALEKNALTQDTLIVLTSDNGCSPSADFPELIGKGHNPSHHFRGHKADVFDGGHRVPYLVRWPAKVKAGTNYDHPVCLTDFMATCADIVGVKLPDNAAEDSVSYLPALQGKTDAPLREAVVHHTINGSFAIRKGNWKLALCAGSGGWSDPRPGSPGEKGLPDTQLFDLTKDIGERNNVVADNPQIVAELTALLEKYISEGRSTAGAKQTNDTPVELRPKPGARVRAKKKAG
jgi:arylsulfatase A-like enzyme